MTQLKPSAAHRLAVEEGRKHHESSKTYSGSLMRPHVPFLSDLISRLEINSALDYGCGKGEQYRWRDPEHGHQTVEERWGFNVRKYDPCWKPFAAQPVGQFDLVICTHTISLIPLGDLDWVIRRLTGHARKAVFIAEKIGGRKKEVLNPGLRAIGWPAERWLDRLAPFADERPELAFIFSSRERVGDSTITTRHRRVERRWFAEVAGPR